MAWPEEISNELPAPRDDEPASLRQDIVDELSDHLQCSLNRELHRGNDELKARQNVLDRFGNPARIAYRLWFDAMKEKMMSQRIALAAVLILTIVCVCMGVVTWQIAQQNHDSNRALLEQNRDANGAILGKLSDLATQQEAYKSLDWNPVKFRLVSGQENGPPAVGFKAQLQSGRQSRDMPTVEAVSDANGTLDFGLVRYGSFILSLAAPWKESCRKSVNVRPGHAVAETIICPTEAGSGEVAFQIDWPDELKAAKFWTFCMIQSAARPIGELEWNEADSPGKYLLISANGNAFDYGRSDPFPSNQYPSNLQPENSTKNISVQPAAKISLSARPWVLSYIRVFAPSGSTGADELQLPENPLAKYYFQNAPKFDLQNRPVGSRSGLLVYDPKIHNYAYAASRIGRNIEPPKIIDAPIFEVKHGQDNSWKITLPNDLAQHLRQYLAADKH